MASSRASSLPQVFQGGGGKVNTPETTKPSHFCEGFVLYGAAPDERYVSAGLGFSGVWRSVESNSGFFRCEHIVGL